ncbi:hypothetical protein ABH892_000565 [Paenibacillus sp. RC254]
MKPELDGSQELLRIDYTRPSKALTSGLKSSFFLDDAVQACGIIEHGSFNEGGPIHGYVPVLVLFAIEGPNVR